MEKKSFSGFTLVELIIVLAIIAILVSLVVSFLTGQLFKGNDARRKGDIDRIKIAVEEYEKDHDCYPLPQLVTCKPDGTGLNPYLKKIPCDPITKASYYYEYDDSVCPKWYRIYTVLQNTNDLSTLPNIGPDGAFNFVRSSENAPIISPLPTSTPSPSASPGIDYDFYGCFNAVCTGINWDENRPGPECDPNYQSSTCYGQCGPPANECMPWN